MNSPMNVPVPPENLSFIGGGEMGRVVRAKNWAATPLGPIEAWPESLRTAVSLVLNSNFPIALAWGPQHIQLYNDGYWPICGMKHPTAMGQNFSECWASAFPVIGAAFRSALAGTTAFLEDQRMFLDRLGYLEETFFTFSFSPIRDEHGAVAGLFHPVTETTGKMLGQRRTRVLHDLAASGLRAHSLAAVLHRSAETLAGAALDLPFVLLYQLDAEGRTARLVAHCGLTPGGPASPEECDLETAVWPFATAAREGKPLLVENVRTRFPGLVAGPYPEAIAAACVQPILPSGREQAVGFLVAGLSPRLPVNEVYTGFLDLLGTTLAHSVAGALAAEAEQQRAEALAEIDRAKTAFFANISHEFRTPLTLMLGPLEDELAEQNAPLPAPRRERLATAHRNSLRLLKLVNSLLDFSRLEAGRMQAHFQPVDLAQITADLAGVFRSAVEEAGLTLTVTCPPLPEPVLVDRDLWESVLLNLLSNAFKHTFSGGITVSLVAVPGQVILTVADSGSGIPAADLPRLFDRFYRVKAARSRSHEGTGIGLSLVRELVRLHGGTVEVSSVEGQGSTFTVSLPRGPGHLPPQQTAAKGVRPAPGVSEANRAWMEQSRQLIPTAGTRPPRTGLPRLLWADDNVDMRQYVHRLLSEHYDVTSVADGQEALAAALADPPALVLTDVMMPQLDGYGLLRELRAHERTARIPVILLSARAGEEAKLGGLEQGADDYLVKPFTARELLARVALHLRLARLRDEWTREQVRAKELEHDAAEKSRLLATEAAARRTLQDLLEEQRQTAAALRKSEAFRNAIFDSVAAEIAVLDRNGVIVAVNAPWRSFAAENGLVPGEPAPRTGVGTHYLSACQSPPGTDDEAGAIRQGIEAVLKGTAPCYTVEYACHTPAQRRWYSLSATPLNTAEGGVVVSHTDISGRKEAERTLQAMMEEYLQLAEAMPQIVWITDTQGQNSFFNQQWVDYTGLSLAESHGHGWSGPFHPDDRPVAEAAWSRAVQSGGIYTVEARLRRKDGVYHWWLIRGIPFRAADGGILKWFGTCTDIHEMKEADNALRDSLREKEALLKEVQHRVKNNLQVIASLLRLEAGRSTAPETKDVLNDMNGRIHSMALLHESLYRWGIFATVDLGAYVRRLSLQCFRAAAPDVRKIQLQLEVGSVRVEMDQALPCGLIVNELIANCLKHGFPDGTGGEIRVELQPEPAVPHQWRLSVSDTGVGLPADFAQKRTQSLGLRLVTDLAAQLESQLEIGAGPGAAFTLRFTILPVAGPALPLPGASPSPPPPAP